MMYNTGQIDAARHLVLTHHYSRRFPANVQIVTTAHKPGGLFGDCGEAIAACLFSIPPTRWNGEVLELSRLVRNQEKLALTPLIAFAVRQAFKAGWDLVVSFADSTQSHHGGIYQAGSWNYAGKREPAVDGIILDGAFIPGRSCNSRWGTRSPGKLTEIIGRTCTPHYDEGKYCYWRANGKKGRRQAQQLGLESFAYPKPHPERCA